ncbi:MAG TPA: DNA primase [Methylococcaceae bacterium]|nr:DNA primase [Methylococcaceae bacterium]
MRNISNRWQPDLNPIESFKTAIRTHGLEPPETIRPGKMHRFPGQGKKRGDAAWCKLFDDMRGGVFGDFSTGLDEHWQIETESTYTDEERAAFKLRIEAERQQRQKEDLQRHEAAAQRAVEILAAAGADPRLHPYALKKAVDLGPLVKRGAWSQRGWTDALLIPIYGADGKISTLEAINADGDKDFLKNGHKSGGFHPVGNISGASRVLIGEGLATVAAVHAVDEAPALAGMDAGNLTAVALTVRKLAPGAEIILLADNDIKTDGTNPGLKAATDAAQSVNGLVAVPELNGQKCDFWDVWHESGADAVRDALAKIRDVATLTVATIATDDGNHWPKPQALTAKIHPEAYPLDALPDIIQEAVEEVAAFVKAPLPLVAGSALGALSLSTQAHCDIERAPGLSGPTGLFLLSIADSGERKTTCDGFFTKGIRQYEAEQAELSKPLMNDHLAELAAWNAERDGLLSAIRDAGKKNKPTQKLREELKELEHGKPEPPRIPRLVLGDETPENLAYTLARKWPSAGVVSSEAGVVFGAHGMNRDSIMRNLGLLNILWDGNSLPIGRRSSESFVVQGARLTVALQIQETTLRTFFDKSCGLARGTGFLARFLVAWPESTQGARPFTDPPETWPRLMRFNHRINGILNTDAPINQQGELVPAMLTFTQGAKRAWVDFHNAIESMLGPGGDLYDVRDVASKTADNAARLAALFHVFTHGIGSAVDEDSFEGASRVAAWHLSEARRFFGELALPVELANAVRLDAWLIDCATRERTHIIPRREAQRIGPVRDKDALKNALQELEDLGRARIVVEGRRKDIHVNPSLLDGR